MCFINFSQGDLNPQYFSATATFHLFSRPLAEKVEQVGVISAIVT